MRQTKFTQCEINWLHSFPLLHFERVEERRTVRGWGVHFGRVNVSHASARQALTWPVPLFNALLPVVCESAGRLFVSAVAAFFPGFIAAFHLHSSRRFHPVVQLLDIISCHPRPRYPVLWLLKEPPSRDWTSERNRLKLWSAAAHQVERAGNSGCLLENSHHFLHFAVFYWSTCCVKWCLIHLKPLGLNEAARFE